MSTAGDVISPIISILATTDYSITIGWSMLPPELQDLVYQYKVRMFSLEAGEHRTLAAQDYVPRSRNSTIFSGLKTGATFKFMVSSCIRDTENCNFWSCEVQTQAIDRGPTDQSLTNSVQKPILTIRLFREFVSFADPGFIPTVLILATTSTSITIGWREEVKRKKFMEETLKQFDVGDCLNAELNIGDQAELLPYDKKWEFPRELLKLDEVLESGAFGIVRKAQAKSIRRSEEFTTVAVKIVLATARLSYMTALTRELKILCYLGQHLNVVNLLGAYTQHVEYGELFVIVGYCRFGNLCDYLFCHRVDFVDQINCSTGHVLQRYRLSTTNSDFFPPDL